MLEPLSTGELVKAGQEEVRGGSLQEPLPTEGSEEVKCRAVILCCPGSKNSLQAAVLERLGLGPGQGGDVASQKTGGVSRRTRNSSYARMVRLSSRVVRALVPTSRGSEGASFTEEPGSWEPVDWQVEEGSGEQPGEVTSVGSSCHSLGQGQVARVEVYLEGGNCRPGALQRLLGPGLVLVQHWALGSQESPLLAHVRKYWAGYCSLLLVRDSTALPNQTGFPCSSDFSLLHSVQLAGDLAGGVELVLETVARMVTQGGLGARMRQGQDWSLGGHGQAGSKGQRSLKQRVGSIS